LGPPRTKASKLARRVAGELQARLAPGARAPTDNSGEFRAGDFPSTLDDLGVRHTLIRAGQPQRNAAVEALHKLILEECWRPAFAATCTSASPGSSDLEWYVDDYNFERVHHGRLTRGPHSRRHRLRRSQGEGEMSRECRPSR
jgi:transposase InsO family protein